MRNNFLINVYDGIATLLVFFVGIITLAVTLSFVITFFIVMGLLSVVMSVVEFCVRIIKR